MNPEQILTPNDVERLLASPQIAFYKSAKQSAASGGDKQQYRHCLDALDHIISRYGISILQHGEHNE